MEVATEGRDITLRMTVRGVDGRRSVLGVLSYPRAAKSVNTRRGLEEPSD
jgi:hypothetical protein